MAELLVVSETETLLLGAQEPEQLLTPEPGPAELLELAQQGPPGPPGLELSTYTAGAAAVSGHKALALGADGLVLHADPAEPGHLGAVVGISTGAAAPGAAVQVRAAGVLAHAGWNWVPDAPVFVGAAGDLVQAPPAASGWQQVVGWARSPTLLLVQLQPPVMQL